MKKIICAAAAAAIAASAFAFGGCSVGEAYVNYTLSEDGTYYVVSEVTGDKRGLTTYEIPATYSPEEGAEAKPVKEIGDMAFARCNNLTSIKLPDTLEKIGKSAFIYCGLTSLEIPSSVTTISYAAFGACDRLTEVTVPESVTTLEPLAFAYCSRLEKAVVNANVTVLQNRVFYNSVATQGGNVFTNTSLKEVHLPKSLKKIEVVVYNGYLVSPLDGNLISDIYFAGTEAEWNGVYFYQMVLKEGKEDEYEEKVLEKDKFLPGGVKMHYGA
ncbi:MAG: leucine-rich repeat domain-containing protein [Clostridia bacterium]|nr:leucine-rich repeat domain-containing protein [Clostridia bacterium]